MGDRENMSVHGGADVRFAAQGAVDILLAGLVLYFARFTVRFPRVNGTSL